MHHQRENTLLARLSCDGRSDWRRDSDRKADLEGLLDAYMLPRDVFDDEVDIDGLVWPAQSGVRGRSWRHDYRR